MDSLTAATLDLACELIRRRSVTPEDDGCQALVAARLGPLGFRCDTLRCGDVTNLWARIGSGRPVVCFAGHTDVVPPGPRDAWSSDPFVPEVRDGRLYGRGAADMKGSIAAFVVAIERHLAAHGLARGSIALLLTSDEEGPATEGTVRVVEMLAARGERIDHCIVGEPSSEQALGDTIKIGRRGTLNGVLGVKGQQGHIAYPHLARNPIHALAPALAELIALRWDEGGASFPPTAFQCSNVHAGTGATNVIPGTLELAFNWRYGTASTRESLVARLREVLDRHGLEYDLSFPSSGLPYYTAPGPLVDAATAAVRRRLDRTPTLSCSGGTSDGRFLAAVSDQVIELGPLNATIHKVDECVAVDDLGAISAVYGDLLADLLGAP
jgi:succinyl-diaminopimelate desuccinylase